MTIAWERALGDFEARIAAAERALDAGEPVTLDAFAEPPVEGPLPAPLLQRATACRDRGLALEERLAAELTRVRAELRRLPRVPRAGRETRFETRA